MSKIQFKRGVKANLPTLNVGEPAFTTDTKEIFIGDGVTNIEVAKQSDLDDVTSQLNEYNYTNIETYEATKQLTDVKDGFIDDLVVKGRTLQNLVSKVTNTTTQYATIAEFSFLKPSTVYTAIVTNTSDVIYRAYASEFTFDGDGNLNAVKGINKLKLTTKPSVSSNILFKNYPGNASFTLENFMLLEGDWTNEDIPSYFTGIKSTSEEDSNQVKLKTYNSDKTINDNTIIQLKEPLRGLPNGVSDTIDYERGILTRNIGKYIITGNEPADIPDSNTNTMRVRISNIPNQKIISVNENGVISNIFANYDQLYLGSIDSEGISCHRNPSIQIRISKSKLQSQDVAGVKAWLQSNNVTVYYQLETPIVEQIDNTEILKTFKDGYLSLENTITPIVNLNYSVNISSVLNSHAEIIGKHNDYIGNINSQMNAKANKPTDFLKQDNGYFKDPTSGIIIQWGGTVSVASGGTLINFPISFVTKCCSVTLVPVFGNALSGLDYNIDAIGNANFKIWHNGSTSYYFRWIAIGY